ncbi:MAG: virulence RhuM family protein [Lachnospiraceae bacterium]|nr:virulence RhuM family protein [Lachnospiraceae bacterium]MDE6252352.1 virulence RhuM family protein [Lachnospiraceae bacterium]
MEKNEVLIYATEDGTVKLEVMMESETVWLNLKQLCELFQRDKSVISRHIRNIFSEGELERDSVVAFFATTAEDGKTYQVAYYNLDVIISVGYRVKSLRGTQFRKWALKILKEYMIKGFALDDDRLKNLGSGNYFEELLSRIRSIRASEKVFWRKILDIYATSIDYDPKSEVSIQLFKQVQNKMHWAVHHHTAAEVIYERADSEKEFMGLTSWYGEFPKRSDTEIAKNYLSREELEILDRLVSAYLDIAELRAMNREPMYMKDWLETIDDYLKMTRRDILNHKGKVSHKQALEKAHKEYEKYSEKAKLHLTAVEKHYLEAISTLKGIEKKQE